MDFTDTGFLDGLETLMREREAAAADPARSGDPRLQAECWEEGGVTRLLLVAQGKAGATAYVLAHDGQAFLAGRAPVRPCPSHHDRAALAAAIPLRGAGLGDLAAFGFHGEAAAVVAQLDLDLAARPGIDKPDFLEMAAARGRGDGIPWRVHHGSQSFAAEVEDAYRSLSLGVAPEQPQSSTKPVSAPGTGDPAPGSVTPFPLAVRTALGNGLAPDRERPARQAAVRAVIDRVAAPLAALHCPEATGILAPLNFYHRAYGHFSAPGRTGMRRRQAGKLHPWAARDLANDEALGRLVDEGRPFEAALARMHALPPAALRRLRSLPHAPPFVDTGIALALARSLPASWLPETPDGWRFAAASVGRLVRPARSLGVRLAEVVAHLGGDFRSLLPHGRSPVRRGEADLVVDHQATGDDAIERGLNEAKDMADRFRDTLVRQARGSLGLPPRNDDTAMAGAILFGGKSLPGIAKLQKEWHRHLAAFDAALPAHEEVNSWPAAFPPYDAGDGYEIVCLTDEPALKAEGGSGPDADGVDGLDHCVGGYGRNCYTGQAHVASVRRRTDDGFVRVSTIELVEHREGRFDEPGEILPAQHYGYRNAPASPEAERAVASLLKALADGSHPLDRDAFARRDPDHFKDIYDWRKPGAMEAAFEAWKPYLPAGIAEGGLGALRERILRLRGLDAAPVPAPGPEPEAEDVPRHGFGFG